MRISLDTKEKSFHATLAIGGVAGLAEGSIRAASLTLHTMFPGMLLTIVAAFFGGFCGFFIKDCARLARGMKPYRGINNDGMMMGAFLGAFLGTLFQVADSADGANLVIGSMTGAFVGALFGALPDEFVTPILQLIHQERDTPGTD